MSKTQAVLCENLAGRLHLETAAGTAVTFLRFLSRVLTNFIAVILQLPT